jgi:hypothetical protein
MKRMKKWIIFAGVLSMAAGISAAMAQGKKKTTPVMPQRNTPLQVSVKTDKSAYKAGDVVTLTMTAKNTLKDAMNVEFSSGQKYDFEIRKGSSKGAKVWQWAADKMFTQALVNRTLKAGEALTFTEKTLPITEKGTYWVQATLTTMGRTPRPMGTATFVVK